MKTRTVTVREGELLGDVDWSHNFLQHFDCMCSSDERKAEECERRKSLLKEVADAHQSHEVSVNMSGSDWYRTVYSVGMYDGWPYWKPTPALLIDGPLGPEWHFFYDIRAVKVGEAKA